MAIKTKAELLLQNTNDITTNGIRSITGAKVNSLNANIIDTMFSLVADVTEVGTGGDYTTVQLAYAAGKKNIKLISDVIESVSWAVAATDYIIVDGTSLLSSANYQIYFNENITITNTACKLWFRNCKISSNNSNVGGTVVSSLFASSVATGLIKLDNVYLDFSRHVHLNGSFCKTNSYCEWENVYINLPNTQFNQSNVNGKFNNITIFGGGTSCPNGGASFFKFNSNTKIQNLFVIGSFITVGTLRYIFDFQAGVYIDNMQDTSTNGGTAIVNSDCTIENSTLKIVGGGTGKLINSTATLNRLNGTISNLTINTINSALTFLNQNSTGVQTITSCDMKGGSFTFTPSGTSIPIFTSSKFDGVTFADVNFFDSAKTTVTNLPKLTDCTIPVGTLSNRFKAVSCNYTGNITLSANSTVNNAPTFAGTLTISGDANTIDSGEVVGALTIEATADKTIVTSTRYASLTDNGTNGILDNNTTI
jgi:hypothetical protein